MDVPADKYLLEDYRQDMRTPSAPQMLDTDQPLLPVKVVGAGIARPNSKQTVHQTTLVTNNVNTVVQIATKTPTNRVFLLGWSYTNTAAVAQVIEVFDASAGNAPAIAAPNTYTDRLGHMVYIQTPATAGAQDFGNLPMPQEAINGIRLEWEAAGAGAGSVMNIYWVEEIV